MDALMRFLLWFLLFAGWSTPVVPVESSLPPGDSLTLAPGVAATLDGGKLAITFERVVEDSRCPADVLCAWSGQVVVALRVEAEGDEVQMVELGGFTDNDGNLLPERAGAAPPAGADVDGYTVQLLAVTPYPAHAGQPSVAEEYQVQVRVSLSEP
jgi:hypothetical protein